MRIVFMGTPAFALPALKELFESEHGIICVYSRPDAVCGRGKKLTPSLIKQQALEFGLNVRTPKTLRDETEQESLAKLEPDVIVVAAYGMILPKEVLEIPRFGCINIHASSLPRWRGAAPVQRAILAGDTQVGVCLMQVEVGLDTGAYHFCGQIDVADKPKDELEEELAFLGTKELVSALPKIEAGSYEWKEQDESLVTYAEKIEKSELLLNPELSCEQFLRRVQASSDSAPARCVICEKQVAVKRAHIAGDVADNAVDAVSDNVFLDKKHLLLRCADGWVEIEELKPQGKKTILAKMWVAGLQNAKVRMWSSIEC